MHWRSRAILRIAPNGERPVVKDIAQLEAHGTWELDLQENAKFCFARHLGIQAQARPRWQNDQVQGAIHVGKDILIGFTSQTVSSGRLYYYRHYLYELLYMMYLRSLRKEGVSFHLCLRHRLIAIFAVFASQARGSRRTFTPEAPPTEK